MKKDIVEKRLEDYNDVFADIFNNLVFGGKRILEEEYLISLPTEAFTRKTDGTIRQGNRDIRKGDIRNGRYRLVCGSENQEGIDNTMPQRIMGYEYASYEEQVRKYMKKNVEAKNPAYTRRIHNDQRLAPVITAVLYWGTEKWKGPRCLHDMLEFPPELEKDIKPYVADYPMNLIDLSSVPKEVRQRMTSDFRLVVEYLACRDDPGEMKKFMSDKERIICHPEEFLDVMSEVASDKRYDMIKKQVQERQKKGEEKEVLTMWKIEDEIENRGIEKGIEKGKLLTIIEAVKKKCQKGKNAQEAAEDLEEEVSLVKTIYDLVMKYPGKEAADILVAYQQESNI